MEILGWKRRRSGEKPRDAKVLLSLTADELLAVRKLAGENGVPVAWYVRALVLRVTRGV